MPRHKDFLKGGGGGDADRRYRRVHWDWYRIFVEIIEKLLPTTALSLDRTMADLSDVSLQEL